MTERLISLAEFDSAFSRQDARQSSAKSLAVFYGFLVLIAVSAVPGRLAAESDPTQHWKMWLPPLVVAIVGTPFVLWYFRSSCEVRNEKTSANICPECRNVCNRTAIHLTGRCLNCGCHFVDAPVEDNRAGTYDLSEVRQLSQRIHRLGMLAIAGLLFGMLICFSLTAMANDSRAVAAAALVLLVGLCAAFVGFLTFIQSGWKAFRCPHCSTIPQNHLWLISTGCCAHCHGPMLRDNTVRSSALIGLSRAEFSRQNRARRSSAIAWLVAAMITMAGMFAATIGSEFCCPAATPVLRTIGVWSSLVPAIISMVMLFGLPSTRKQMMCRECRACLCDTPHTVATGNCTRCGTRALE